MAGQDYQWSMKEIVGLLNETAKKARKLKINNFSGSEQVNR